MPSDTTADPTTLGSESGRVALRRRRDKRTDHVHEIPFNERAEVTCEDCGESIMVGIYGATERSYDSCWTWDCDAYHKFVRDRDAEADAEPAVTETKHTTLVTDGGVDQKDGEVPQRQIEVVVKSTRIGNLATFADTSAGSGVRSMTDAEIEAHDFLNNLIEKIDADAHESGDVVAEVTVSEDGECSVEWNEDAVRTATDGGVDCHEPTTTADADLPRTNGLPEIRFVDRFESDDDVFYALRGENGVRLYRVTGATTIGARCSRTTRSSTRAMAARVSRRRRTTHSTGQSTCLTTWPVERRRSAPTESSMSR